MTARNLWDDARDTAVETTRELFAPLTYVVRKITSSGRPAMKVEVATRNGQVFSRKDQRTVEPSTNPQPAPRGQRGSRDSTPEPRSRRARG